MCQQEASKQIYLYSYQVIAHVAMTMPDVAFIKQVSTLFLTPGRCKVRAMRQKQQVVCFAFSGKGEKHGLVVTAFPF